MPEHDHPSSFRVSDGFAPAARQAGELRDRSRMIKCSNCSLIFIGTAVPPIPSSYVDWVCPVCAEAEGQATSEPEGLL
jgi:hypothetical protein